MKVGTFTYSGNVDDIANNSVLAEESGLDSFWAIETKTDALIASTLVAERTESISLGTSVAVALSRSPMTVAVGANDIQRLSGGRFTLGLGTQTKAHITKRYSMPWSKPASRIREFVVAVKEIWRSWENDTGLDFRGEFYNHTLMNPTFNPGVNPYGPPKIYLAGVGERMTEVAGEVADGFLCHSLTTSSYLNEVTLPALRRGRAKVGKTLEGFDVIGTLLVAGSASSEERQQWEERFRKAIAFYGSTPTYRRVLELHGWGELGDRLSRMSGRGEWASMPREIDDEVLHTFAVVGDLEYSIRETIQRFGGVVDCATLESLGTRNNGEGYFVTSGLRSHEL